MAWKSGGASHSELIHNLRKNGIIKTDKVFEVMLATDRSHYAKCNPYMDSPQSIGFQATISAPHMHAYALELLFDQLHEGAKALDVGSGSGILTACFARMVGASGKVIGIDHIKELVDDSINNVRKDDPMLLSSGRVQLVANRPIKAWWKIDIASRTRRWKSDAGAVRQATRWQCQNETSDGSDIRAFNR
uniref:Protein-L-isoaspartate(D-aspartate) O-methyltransferase n=1 Tax=Rousettus aegyptiacus TaxID=9407 RepID=A0A7J8KDY1_ROUAE|nr:protein-L-isoaspartate (D-aspartate) O-methyltransferase [Rousettus aegyptiacus]